MSISLSDNIRSGGGVGRRGFTMSEILVVMAIMVILATLAIPAMNVLSGSRSIEAGSNLATATLARARAEAIARRETIGVAIYFDQDRQRTALALVGYAQKWREGVSYQRGDYVYTDDTTPVGTPVRLWWLCHTAHVSETGAGSVQENRRPDRTTTDNTGVIYNSSKWAAFAPNSAGGGVAAGRSSPDNLRYMPSPAGTGQQDTYVSILPETEVIYLPPGIGAQVLVGTRTATTGAITTDRYLRASVVFFDEAGKLAPQAQWGVTFDPEDAPAPVTTQATPRTTNFVSSRLGLAIRFNYDETRTSAPRRLKTGVSFNLDTPAGANGNYYNTQGLRGGYGVVLYDRQSYETANSAALTGVGKWDSSLMNETYSANEANAETWLDANGTLLLINRYTGALLRAE